MGNVSGRRGGSRHGSHNDLPRPPPLTQPEIYADQYVFSGGMPYPTRLPPPHTVPAPIATSSINHRPNLDVWIEYPYVNLRERGVILAAPPAPPPPPLPYIEKPLFESSRSYVTMKEQTLRLEPDKYYPGKSLVSFTFDAAFAGSITLMFLAKDYGKGDLAATREDILPSITVNFQKGLNQAFKQPSGTGIDFSTWPGSHLLTVQEINVYPLAVVAKVLPSVEYNITAIYQITYLAFEKKNGEYQVRIVKQSVWIDYPLGRPILNQIGLV